MNRQWTGTTDQSEFLGWGRACWRYTAECLSWWTAWLDLQQLPEADRIPPGQTPVKHGRQLVITEHLRNSRLCQVVNWNERTWLVNNVSQVMQRNPILTRTCPLFNSINCQCYNSGWSQPSWLTDVLIGQCLVYVSVSCALFTQWWCCNYRKKVFTKLYFSSWRYIAKSKCSLM